MMGLRTLREKVGPYWTHRRSPLVLPRHRAALVAALRTHEQYRDAVISEWMVTPRGNLVGRLHQEGNQPGLMVKVHLHGTAQGDTQRNFQALQVLATLPAPPHVEIPQPIDLLTANIKGICYLISVETEVLSGHIRVAGSIPESRLIDAWGRMASTWSAPDRLSYSILSTRVEEFFAIIPKDPLQSKKLGAAIARACDALQEGEYVLFRGVEHGDLAPGNLLLAAGGRAGVIDWVDMRVVGLPDLDLIHLVLYHHARSEGGGFVRHWTRLLNGVPPASLLARYGSVRQVSALAVAYWIQFICRSIGHSGRSWRELHLWHLGDLIEATWK
jgi:hypothetical protein